MSSGGVAQVLTGGGAAGSLPAPDGALTDAEGQRGQRNVLGAECARGVELGQPVHCGMPQCAFARFDHRQSLSRSLVRTKQQTARFIRSRTRGGANA